MENISNYSNTSSRILAVRLLIILLAVFALYFIADNVLQYFVWSEESYGPYYWQYRLPLLFHVIGGFIALLAGLFQLWTGLNRTGKTIHPLTGRIYVLGILIGSAGALILSVSTSTFGPTFGVALFWLAVFWLLTTGAALYAIHHRRAALHREWMVRSYILTFGFVVFRVITDYVPYEAWWGMSREAISNATIWSAWVVPYIGYELLLLKKAIRK